MGPEGPEFVGQDEGEGDCDCQENGDVEEDVPAVLGHFAGFPYVDGLHFDGLLVEEEPVSYTHLTLPTIYSV